VQGFHPFLPTVFGIRAFNLMLAQVFIAGVAAALPERFGDTPTVATGLSWLSSINRVDSIQASINNHVAFFAEPLHLKRFAVIRVMSLCLCFRATPFTTGGTD
jgi:hypothetical protein